MSKKQFLKRAENTIRSISAEGIFTGYLTVWGVVDSHNSVFTRGSFAKTIAERKDKVKVMYDHDTLIGKVLDVREDDHGVFVECKLNLDVQAARETHAFLTDGTLEGLSFMFRSIQEGYRKDGVLAISEVALFECGPVNFPSNEAATVESVRSTVFSESVTEEESYWREIILQDAMNGTLSSIWWSEMTNTEKLTAFDTALSDYRSAYLSFATEQLSITGYRYKSPDNLINSVNTALKERSKTPEQIAVESALTLDQVIALRAGRVINVSAYDVKTALGDDVLKELQNKRNTNIEKLAVACRDIHTDVEKDRLRSLLSLETNTNQDQPEDDTENIRDAINFLRDLQNG